MARVGQLRMTPSRRAIVEELRKSTDHPSADEIYRLVRKRLPRVSLGTIYRNLDLLERHGVIRSLGECGEQRRYDGVANDHYHVRCECCGRVEDIDIEPLAGIIDRVEGACNYEVRGYRLSFVGICADCAARNGRKSEARRGGEDGSQGQ